MAKTGSYAERRLAEVNAPAQAADTADVAPELTHVAHVGGLPVYCNSAEAAHGLRTALTNINDLMFRTGAL